MIPTNRHSTSTTPTPHKPSSWRWFIALYLFGVISLLAIAWLAKWLFSWLY